jgi:FkbM family methyltransferase
MHVLKSFIRYIAGTLLPKIHYPVIRGPLKGSYFRLGALAGQGGGASVYIGGVEPEQTSTLLSLLRPSDIFFDIGANVGYYTILSSRLVGPSGKVVAIEPVIRNLLHLYDHVKKNNAQNVEIIPAVCAERQGFISFQLGSNSATGKIANLDRSAPSTEYQNLTFVCATTVDTIIQQTSYIPTVVKIDVEGAERYVLEGAKILLATSKPTILLSVHSEKLRDDCLEYLSGFGYIFECLGDDNSAAMEFVARPVQ